MFKAKNNKYGNCLPYGIKSTKYDTYPQFESVATKSLDLLSEIELTNRFNPSLGIILCSLSSKKYNAAILLKALLIAGPINRNEIITKKISRVDFFSFMLFIKS